MNIIDLTHTIKEDMPVFPGTVQPILDNALTIEKDGFREKKLTMFSHTGTHIDAPAHMIDGNCLNDFDADKFIGKIAVIEADAYEVSLEIVMSYEEQIRHADFVLLKTDWSKKWDSSSYFEKFPAISLDSAKYLAQFGLKGYGVDAISVNHMENADFDNHKIFMDSDMILIENLNNLDKVETGNILSVLPLKIKDADGSPVRAVAIQFD